MPAPQPTMISPEAAGVLHRAAMHPESMQTLQSGAAPMHGAVRSAMASGAMPGTPAERTHEKSKANNQRDEKPGFITRALDRLNGLGSGFFMYDFFVAMGLAAAVGGVGKGLSWVGEKTGVKALGSVGGWFGRRSDNLQAPRKYMEGITLDKSLSRTTESLHGKTAQWFGEESAVAQGMGRVAEEAQKAQASINSATGTVFRRATTAMGNVVERVDAPMHGMAGFRQRRAVKHHVSLRDELQKAKAVLQKHEAALRGGAKSAEAGAHMDVVRKGFDALHGMMQEVPTAEMAQKAESLLAQVRDSYAELHKLHKDEETLKGARKEVNKALGRLHKPMARLSENAQKSAFWQDVPGAIRNLPKSMGKMDLHQAAFNSAITVGTLAEGAHTAFAIKHDFHILKRMIAVVEGKKESEISTLHALVGDVPPVIREARHHFFGKHGPEAIAETLAAGLNLTLMKKGGAGMAAMSGLMLAPMAGQALADKSPMLEMYDALDKLQAAGRPLNAAMYAEFVATSYKKAQDLGMHNRLVQALGKEYEGVKASAGDILKDIASGKIDERAAALEQKFAEQDKASVAKDTVDAKPAVGKHSAKVLEGRVGAAVNAAQPVANDDARLAGSELHTTDVGPRNSVSQITSAGRLVASPSQAVGGAA